MYRSQVCNFIKKVTLAPVLFCKFCDISKNTFSYRIPQVAASVRMTTALVRSKTVFAAAVICSVKPSTSNMGIIKNSLSDVFCKNKISCRISINLQKNAAEMNYFLVKRSRPGRGLQLFRERTLLHVFSSKFRENI